MSEPKMCKNCGVHPAEPGETMCARCDPENAGWEAFSRIANEVDRKSQRPPPNDSLATAAPI